MTRRLVLLVAVAAIAVVAASGASSTTVPGQVYAIKVTITDKAITIQKDKFSLHSPYPRYPRGALIRYEITNKGTKAYALKIWQTTTVAIKPGGHDSVLLNWAFRGAFVYETLSKGKPAGPRGHVTIF